MVVLLVCKDCRKFDPGTPVKGWKGTCEKYGFGRNPDTVACQHIGGWS